jgi:hypothetical protein
MNSQCRGNKVNTVATPGPAAPVNYPTSPVCRSGFRSHSLTVPYQHEPLSHSGQIENVLYRVSVTRGF